MSFLNPAFLWTLLLAAPLVAVYLLKVRPRRAPVTALFLWDRVFTERRSSALFRRLRDAISLAIMLAVLAAIALAGARPRFHDADDRNLLVLIDNSASMSAADAGGAFGETTRLDAAKREAKDILRALAPGRRGAVASVSDELEFHAFLTESPRELRDAVDAVAPTDRPSHPAALAALGGVADLEDRLRVILISDAVGDRFGVPEGVALVRVGAGATGPGGALGPVPAAAVTSGTGQATPRAGGSNASPPRTRRSAPNAGFVAADLVARSGGDDLALLFRIASSFDEPTEVEISLLQDDLPLKVIPVALQPGLNDPQLLHVTGGPGRYQLRLALAPPNGGAGSGPRDALADDDVAYLAVHPPRPVRVGVAAADRYFFEHAVLAFEESEGLLRLAHSGEAADLVVARGDVPRAGSRAGAGEGGAGGSGGGGEVSGGGGGGGGASLAVVFEPAADSPWVASLGDELESPLPRLRAEDHPALRFIPVESLLFSGARRATLPEGAAVLVEDAGGTPLVWQLRTPEHAALVFNMDPAIDDFFLSPYFPLAVHGAATHLGGRTRPVASTYPVGADVPPPGLRPGETASITPAGSDAAMEVPQDRAYRVRRAGFHHAQAPAGDWDLAASLLDAGESRMIPAEDERPGEALPRGRPPWMLLVAAALVLLVAEEFLYHRRKVG